MLEQVGARLSGFWLALNAYPERSTCNRSGGYAFRSIVRPSQFIAAPNSRIPEQHRG